MRLIRLNRDFFDRPTIKVAKELLGKYLVRKIGKKTSVGRIAETEAYIGPDDKASHASFGRTKRCQPMYGPPGIAYVYFIYGMYWMLNIVTEKEGKPCAILIRAVEPLNHFCLQNGFQPVIAGTSGSGQAKDLKELKKLGSGPGKFCRWLKIDGQFNGEDLAQSKRLFICKRVRPLTGSDPDEQIIVTTRIGVDYAGKWAKKPWRFYLKDNLFVSRK